MADQKTKPHEGDVTAFVEALTDHQQRLDCHALIAMMTKVTGEKPILWGSAIIGFGSYHYRYASGHEGNAPRLAFSPARGKSASTWCATSTRCLSIWNGWADMPVVKAAFM